MVLRTKKPTIEERAAMNHEELLRAVWLLDEVTESFRWIPVTERLPEPHTDVLVAVMDVSEETSTFIDCLTDNNGTLTWDTFNGALQRVPAWMPLPESYKQD